MTSDNYNIQATGTPDHELIDWMKRNGQGAETWHRKFESIVVEYPPEEVCEYPEYKGKPYFSIKYEENGEHFIGFGTYKPKVLSQYLIDYFIVPIIMEADKEGK